MKRQEITEALMAVQREKGWVADEDVERIAASLGLTADEVDGLATFEELVFRQPVGRHVILVCDSVSCYVTGYPEVLQRLTARLGVGLGGTTPDGRFTLLPAGCLGLCEQAPAMTIDGEVFGNLTPARVDEALDGYAAH
jgi:NADH-quinone oxidoreductase subunit E